MSFGRSNFPLVRFAAAVMGLATSALHAQTVANFVNVTPCRLIDTRDARYNNGGLGQPSLPAKSIRSFDILASTCAIPSNATAYSLNITVVPHGPLPYLTIWPTGQTQPEVSTLNSYTGAVAANAAVVPAGTGGQVSVYVDGPTDVLMDINGYFTPYVAPVIPPSTTIQQITQQVTQQITQSVALPTILAQSSSGYGSLAIGNGSSSIGSLNTAIGFNTLGVVGTGQANVALGSNALASNSQGNNNVAIGSSALTNNAAGSNNIAIGTNALLNGRMNSNIAIGQEAMFSSTNGQNNTALGFSALSGGSIGSNNVAVGYQAGMNVNADSNIEIGNVGTNSDAQTIRIGTQGLQTRTFLAGVSATAVGPSAAVVYVNNNGQLGIYGSSQRFKEDIQDLPAQNDRLAQLRPVQFRYKEAAPDGSKPLQYGLIAEEVEAIYPELVVHDADGKPLTVAYQELPALLLQQIQQQQKLIADLESRLIALETQAKQH